MTFTVISRKDKALLPIFDANSCTLSHLYCIFTEIYKNKHSGLSDKTVMNVVKNLNIITNAFKVLPAYNLNPNTYYASHIV